MLTPVYVPRWGITMERGLIAAWHVKEGDRVVKGQPLLDLETEKATNLIESPADGVIRAILFPAGESPIVGELIAVIGEPDESFDVAALRGAENAATQGDATRAPRATRVPERNGRGRARAAPAARKLAQEHGIDLANVAGTGPEGSISREDVGRALVDAVAATVEDSFIAVGDLRLHYVAAGGAKTGLKTSDLPVVLVHGLGGSTLLWQSNITALAICHRVVALDLPGHGLSDKLSANYNIEFIAKTLLGFLDAMSLGHVAFVGHSLGGHVCLQTALDQPQRVARLVLVDSGGLGTEINTDWLQPMLTGLTRDATETMLLRLFRNSALATRSMVEATHSTFAQPGAWDALVSATRAFIVDGSQSNTLVKRLGQVMQPVLIVWGADDAIIPIAHAHTAQTAIPGAQLWVAENAGHCPQLEAPDAFNAQCLAFLAR